MQASLSPQNKNGRLQGGLHAPNFEIVEREKRTNRTRLFASKKSPEKHAPDLACLFALKKLS
jgi:hypothetical protein